MFRRLIVALTLFAAPMVAKETAFAREIVEGVVSSLIDSTSEWLTSLLEIEYGPGEYTLSASRSQLNLPRGYAIMVFSDEDDQEPPLRLEAIVSSTKQLQPIFFLNYKKGYLSLEDWESVDPQALLQFAREHETDDAVVRKDWVIEPMLDRAKSSVFFALESEDNEGGIERLFTVVKFSRRGAEAITWARDERAPASFHGAIEEMFYAHHFLEGEEYEAFREGDAVSGHTLTSFLELLLFPEV